MLIDSDSAASAAAPAAGQNLRASIAPTVAHRISTTSTICAEWWWMRPGWNCTRTAPDKRGDHHGRQHHQGAGELSREGATAANKPTCSARG